MFYNTQPGSQLLAEAIQTAFRETLCTGNKRQIKKASGVYLMDHINCSGVLIECGFLSNYREESLLRSETYQQKICCIIATTVSQYLNT